MDYYLSWMCPSCDEENYYGLCRTYLTHNDLPVVSLDAGSQERYDCEHCGKSCYSGDFDLMHEEDL